MGGQARCKEREVPVWGDNSLHSKGVWSIRYLHGISAIIFGCFVLLSSRPVGDRSYLDTSSITLFPGFVVPAPAVFASLYLEPHLTPALSSCSTITPFNKSAHHHSDVLKPSIVQSSARPALGQLSSLLWLARHLLHDRRDVAPLVSARAGVTLN